jgi:phenylacetate-CoA ligase
MDITKSKYLNLIRLLRNERRSLDELIHNQNIALQKLVRHSYNTVKFYKTLFDSHGLHPEDIKTFEDITKIPIIDKNTLQQNSFEDLTSKDYKKGKLIPVTTTGSSGIMLKFFIDKRFDQLRKAQFLRPYITNGRGLFDKTLVFSAPKPAIKKWFQHLGFMAEKRVFYNTGTFEQIYEIQKIKPVIIQGCASVLNLIALMIIDKNIPIPKPRLVFTDSEVLTCNMKENIKKAFDAKVIDIYGTYETDNIAYECLNQNGYHIAADCVLMEFIRDGKKTGPFEEGEIIVTVLNNFAMPFIRYNLHDIGSYSDRTCSCGRTFPLLNKIRGRSDNYIVTPEGQRIAFVNFGAYLHPLTKFVYEFQIIQEDISTFTVFIVPNNSFNNDECKNTVASVIYKYFPDADIDFKIVPSIKREGAGKLMTFISKVTWPVQNM